MISKHGIYCQTYHINQGHDAIFVCVNKLSKMAHIIVSTTTMTTKETTKLFKDCDYNLYSIPFKLINDRDSRFTNRF